MIYRGHVQNGLIVLDEKVTLPEGTVVLVEQVVLENGKRIAERYKNLIGIVLDMPIDMSENHDLYIHGVGSK
jgi:hypothetical protein